MQVDLDYSTSLISAFRAYLAGEVTEAELTETLAQHREVMARELARRDLHNALAALVNAANGSLWWPRMNDKGVILIFPLTAAGTKKIPRLCASLRGENNGQQPACTD